MSLQQKQTIKTFSFENNSNYKLNNIKGLVGFELCLVLHDLRKLRETTYIDLVAYKNKLAKSRGERFVTEAVIELQEQLDEIDLSIAEALLIVGKPRQEAA